MDYFSLRALAREWNALLVGASIADVWTQARGELSVLLDGSDGRQSTLRVGCDPSLPILFRADGGGRQKRNTSSVFEGIAGRTVVRVDVADRDRHLFLRLDGGSVVQILLFGSRPNVFWVQVGVVRDAFLRTAESVGESAPAPRAAPDPTSAADFRERWSAESKSAFQSVRRAAPLLPTLLAADVCRIAGLQPDDPPDDSPDSADPARLAESYEQIRSQLESPAPVVYQSVRWAEAVLPTPLRVVPEAWTSEPFDSVDAAVRAFAKRALGQRRFRTLFQPVESALAAAARKKARSADAMLEELSQPSRADRYEHWAHLIMAQAGGQGAGTDEITLPDILSDGAPCVIALDPALTAVQNAERLYDRARRSRRAREEAEARWDGVRAEAEAAAELLERLRSMESVPDLQAFLEEESEGLKRVVRRDALGGESEPFRRIPLPGGVEALVGKNARGNAELTTRIAQPHDYWLHARGVPGSHVVVRRPSRTWQAPDATLEAAAQIAAYFSNAKSQPLAPVTVTERKYVRPIKGGAPGLVRVDREDVRIVKPALPKRDV